MRMKQTQTCTWSMKYWYCVLARYPCVMWCLFGYVSPTKREQGNKMETWIKRLIATIFLEHVSSAIVAVAKTQWLLFMPVKMSLLMMWFTLLRQLMYCALFLWYPAQVNFVPLEKWQLSGVGWNIFPGYAVLQWLIKRSCCTAWLEPSKLLIYVAFRNGIVRRKNQHIAILERKNEKSTT